MLCGEMIPNDEYALATPAACVNSDAEYIYTVADTGYAWELERNLLHETIHMMENRLWKECMEHNIDFELSWCSVNPDGFEYSYDYNQSEEDGEDPDKYTCDDWENEAYFIDDYAKINSTEDRARTLERMFYPCDSRYFESGHLLEKANLLSALIRASFPCVAACQEPVLWEARTGIVSAENYGW